MTRQAVLPGLDPATYQRHMLHHEERAWVEKNCYIDIWIELLHALGVEPLAALGGTAAIDFEGDNFTFFKPPHEELRDLYGVDVQEMNCWRPLVDHAVEHLGAGKFISTESDSFYLPDTSGTDYKRNHVKTTIVLCDIDTDRGRLGYFHNAGYHWLEGEDYAKVFRVDAPPDPAFLPLFAELVRKDRLVKRPRAELATMARGFLRRHLERRPATNPIVAFQRRFERDLPWLTEKGLNFYHAWAFATSRQLGSCAELLALHLRWLGDDLAPAADEFDKLSATAKTFILKAARAVNAKRALDASAIFDEMAQAWAHGMDILNKQGT